MYIKTVKLKDLRALSVIIAVLLVLAALMIVIIGASKHKTIDYDLKTESDRQQFLADMGWKVGKKYESCRQVTIPEKFTAVYKNYNELQKQQGFDLSEYKGKNVTIYTYAVKNYKNSQNPEAIKATQIVYKGKLIGGDVCSIELNGFMQGLRNRDAK